MFRMNVCFGLVTSYITSRIFYGVVLVY